MPDLFTLVGTIAVNADAANREIANTSGRAGGLAKRFDSIGNSVVSLGRKIKSAIVTAGVAKAITSLSKASISAYAEYEQLVGGIETLFGAGGLSLEEYAASVGKSVEKVQAEYNSLMNAQSAVFANAQQAYKTAGLSANEYMETATSFAASLVSSLKGDTEKAAKLTDMAVTDMSDNANKMGTSMGSIQNAYQGFTKQNFTMLDNLKLGYGGTKKEMQRLLKDAQKISGQKYNIKNLDDIIEAIHVIQTEMGITGTTAEEASKTISGSWNATKSAWDNLMIGLSDGNADIDTLFDNLVSSGTNVIKNVGKVIPTVAKNVVRTVGNLLETAGRKIEEAWENTVYPAIKNKLKVKFGIELPEWETIKSTITTKWAEVQAAFSEGGLVKAITVLLPDWSALTNGISEGMTAVVWPGVQDLFAFTFGINLPDWGTIETQISDWWNGSESVYSKIKSLLSWTLGEFVAPATESFIETIKTWWASTGQPAVTDAVQWTFCEVVLPSWADFVGDVTTWWETTIQPKIKEITTWSFGEIQLPSPEEIAEKIKTWWDDVLGLVNFYQEYDQSKVYTPEELNSGEKWTIDTTSGATTPVKIEPTEDSEAELQSTVAGYDLEGDALIKADPSSKGKLQSYLDGLKLSVDVKLNPVGASNLLDGLGGIPGHATGLDYVPTDNYLAYLHRGEAVLTAAEAAVWRRGMNWNESASSSKRNVRSNASEQPITVNLTVNGVSSSPYAIADEVKNALELLRWQG